MESIARAQRNGWPPPQPGQSLLTTKAVGPFWKILASVGRVCACGEQEVEPRERRSLLQVTLGQAQA